MDPDTRVRHMTQVSRSSSGRLLWECLQEWQDESLQHLGEHSDLLFAELLWHVLTSHSRLTSLLRTLLMQ